MFFCRKMENYPCHPSLSEALYICASLIAHNHTNPFFLWGGVGVGGSVRFSGQSASELTGALILFVLCCLPCQNTCSSFKNNEF